MIGKVSRIQSKQERSAVLIEALSWHSSLLVV